MGIHGFAIRTSCLATILSAVLSITSAAQEPVAAKKESNAAQLEEMGRIVRMITISRNDSGTRRPLEMRAEPLHRWNDPTRGFSDGALWVWGSTGRPAALTAVELYEFPNNPGFWSIEMVSLASGPLEAEGQDRAPGQGPSFHWAPPAAGLEMKPVPGAPNPAANESARLRQAREIAARFTAEEVNHRTTEQRYVLRLLPRPLYRYSDPAASLLDGAIFVFANGTNPETLLLIEARGDGPLAVWSYGTARLSRAAPEVFLDGRMVWSLPYVRAHGSEEPYFIASMPRLKGN